MVYIRLCHYLQNNLEYASTDDMAFRSISHVSMYKCFQLQDIGSLGYDCWESIPSTAAIGTAEKTRNSNLLQCL